MSISKIGFIGLGNMCKPMVKRLLSRGFAVTGCDQRREVFEELRGLGLQEATSPGDAARDTEVTISMVRDTRDSEVAILGEHGVLEGIRPGATLIIMSTIYPDFCQRVVPLFAEKGAHVLESPVSAGPARAEQGALGLMVGGEKQVMESCRPVLEAMGKVFYCGGAGTGMVAKLANNAVTLATVAAVSEAMAMARSYGMEETQMLEIFKSGSASSFVVNDWERMKRVRDTSPVNLHNGMKDLRMCLDIANRKEVRMPVTALISHLHWEVFREKEA